MTITPINGIIPSAPLQKQGAVAGSQLSQASDTPPPAKPSDASSISFLPGAIKFIASSGLYDASLGLAQLNGQAQTADNAVQQIISILQRLRTIAQQVSSSGASDASVTSLETQFNSLYLQIDQVASGTAFGGKKLLNGSFTINASTISADTTPDSGFTIPDLSLKGLFGSRTPSVSSKNSAFSSLQQIDGALSTAIDADTGLKNIGSQFSAAAAALQSAQSNQYAATANLTESDLSGFGFVSLLSALGGKPVASANAQTSRLSGNIAKLLG